MNKYQKIAIWCLVLFCFAPKSLYGQIDDDGILLTLIPQELHFYPRDLETDSCIFTITGETLGTANEVLVKVTQDDLPYSEATVAGTPFSLTIPIDAGLYLYDVSIFWGNGSDEWYPVITVQDVVCGDVFLINGQSNAVASDYQNEQLADIEMNTFVRSYGSSAADSGLVIDHEFGVAVAREGYIHASIGQWGLRLANQIKEMQALPILVINGACGGTMISQHQRNDSDSFDINTIYGRLLFRANAAGVAHAVRGIFWHQGESDDGLAYVTYLSLWIAMYEDWLEDYPSVEGIYPFQVRAGCGDPTWNRIVQRDLPDLLPLVIGHMSTTGVDGHDGCHFYHQAYMEWGERMARLVNRDLYGTTYGINIDAPDPITASWITADKLEIQFGVTGNGLYLQPGAKDYFSLSDDSAIADAEVVSTTVVLTVATPNNATWVSFVDQAGDIPWLLNELGIGSFAWYQLPITVNETNNNPVANNISFSTNEDLTYSDTLSATDVDGDTLSFSINTAPGNGNVSIDNTTTGSFSYTGNADYHGTDSFTYFASDATDTSNTATVSITINAVNDAPIIDSIPDITMTEDSDFFYNLSIYINDIDNDYLNISGSVSMEMSDYVDVYMDGPDTLHLTAHDDWYGSGTVHITVDDGELSSIESFILTVSPVNDMPYFEDMFALVGVGMEFHIPIYFYDVDVDTHTVSFDASWTYPDWLSLSVNPYRLDGIAPMPGEISFPLVLSDGDTSVTDTFILAAEFFHPVIDTIVDVPDDQGGRVYVGFSASFFDQPGDTNQSYSVFRYDTYEDTSGWVSVQSIDALGEESYVYEVLTVRDSTVDDNGMTQFMVVASMNAGIFHSMPDSGYSVDNIAPGVPTGIEAIAMATSIVISWDASADDDFHYFAVERSVGPDFTADILMEFEMVDTTLTDETIEMDTEYFYRVVAFDYTGNMSNYSDVVSATALAIDPANLIPEVFALHQNYPNPFNPTTQIKYDLPEDALVSINIYDLMGRSIKSLVNSQQTAGYRSIQWNATNNLGEPVSAGMYIYTIKAGEFRQTKKMVLLK